MESVGASQDQPETHPASTPWGLDGRIAATAFRDRDLFTAPWAVYGRARGAWWISLAVALFVAVPLGLATEFSFGVIGKPAFLVVDAVASSVIVFLMASFAAVMTGAAYDEQRLTPVGMFRILVGRARQVAILFALMLGVEAVLTAAMFAILGDKVDAFATTLETSTFTMAHSDLIAVVVVSLTYGVLNFVATYLVAYAVTLVAMRNMETLRALKVSIGQIIRHPVKTIIVYTGIVILWAIALAILLAPVMMIIAVGSIAAGDMSTSDTAFFAPLVIVFLLSLVGGTWIGLVTNAMASIQALRFNATELEMGSDDI